MAADTTTSTLHLVTEDDCCGAALSKALASGKLAHDAETWTHRKCGVEWRSRLADGIVVWYPVQIIQVWR